MASRRNGLSVANFELHIVAEHVCYGSCVPLYRLLPQPPNMAGQKELATFECVVSGNDSFCLAKGVVRGNVMRGR